MPLTDENILTAAAMIFTFAFTFMLGERKHPAFFVISGVIGLIFSFTLYSLVSNLVLSLMIIAVSIIIMVYGITKRPNVEEV